MVLKQMPLKVKACGLTETGLVRQGNEDAWLSLPMKYFYALADGMGGHQAGEVASQQTVRHLCEMMDEVIEKDNASGRTARDVAIMLRLAIVETNRRVYKLSLQDLSLKGMGTTLCCFMLHGRHIVYGHLGDSRIYRMRDGVLEQLTKDHSLYRQMKDKGQLPKGKAGLGSYKNIVTKCVGTGWLVDPTIGTDTVKPGDLIMMCSDGLTDMLSNPQIEDIMTEWPGVDESCHALVEAAMLEGGVDNITVVVAKITEDEGSDEGTSKSLPG